MKPNHFPRINSPSDGYYMRRNAVIVFLVPLVLFIGFAAIYAHSIPGRFNTVHQNRKYFDSDGEFITRQFVQDKIFTHNDHLLYHILAKALYKAIPALEESGDAVTPHKALSVFFGALGVVFLYLFGFLVTKQFLLSLLCAMCFGGTAGWWFFSATIDTYIPCLSVSIPVLGLAMLALKGRGTRLMSLGIGIMAGLAFLFRTDSVLLIFMSAYLIRNQKTFIRDGIMAAIAGVMVGITGYAVLSHLFYDIPINVTAMSEWITGAMLRPESTERIWGVATNLTMPNFALMLVNQCFYTILIPGLMSTREPAFYSAYSLSGWVSLLLWMATILTALYHIGSRICRGSGSDRCFSIITAALAFIWFLSRLLFYTWWDPRDPFLFAVMAMPALWIIVLLGFCYAREQVLDEWKWRAHLALLVLFSLSVWIHNYLNMINPLRESCS